MKYLLLLLIAADLQAAIAYRCVITSTYAGQQQTTVEHVTVSGKKQRIDIDTDPNEGIASDALLSTDGGVTHIALNSRTKTWFATPPANGSLLMPQAATVSRIKTAVSPEESEPVDAYPTKKFVAKASFMAGEMNVALTFLAWTTDSIAQEASVCGVAPRTGIKEVDAVWTPQLATITGFRLKSEIASTRHYEGGRPVTQLVTTVVEEIRTIADPPDSFFAAPKNYTNQGPVFGAPGTGSGQ